MKPLATVLLSCSSMILAGCASAENTKAPPPAPATPEDPAPGGEGASPAGPSGSGPGSLEQACPDAATADVDGAEACTEMGCSSGYVVDVTPLGSWPAGDYRYVMQLDGKTVTCEGSLPLKACGQRSITCDDAAISITESGCAMDPATHAFGGFSLSSFPAEVHLRIEHGGKALVDRDLEVAYRTSQPNGAGCGPVCCQGGDSVKLEL